MIEENVQNLFKEVPEYNSYGENVMVVAAVKTRSVADINSAIAAGIKYIGDNHVQEFRDKYPFIEGNPQRHFIGRLQTNKIKYLLGKCDLYHSLDRFPLAEALSEKSASRGLVSEALIEINAGGEESKGGFSFEETEEAVGRICALPALRISGIMAMLPQSDDVNYLKELALRVRETYDGLKKTYGDFRYLSMGMSGDWKLCVECGSNMIRIGTAIFGERIYPQK